MCAHVSERESDVCVCMCVGKCIWIKTVTIPAQSIPVCSIHRRKATNRSYTGIQLSLKDACKVHSKMLCYTIDLQLVKCGTMNSAEQNAVVA